MTTFLTHRTRTAPKTRSIKDPSARFTEVIYETKGESSSYATPVTQVVSYESGKRIVHSQTFPVYKGEYTYTLHLDREGNIVKMEENFCPEVEMGDVEETETDGDREPSNIRSSLLRAQRRLAK